MSQNCGLRYGGSICLRPLAGMCCVIKAAMLALPFGWVAVPWRGCVVSEVKSMKCVSFSFRPLAGMCCVESAMSDQYLGAIVSVPWRGCVVSPGLPQYVLLKGSFRPLAGMWYVLLKHLRKTLSPKCFRPLAGMCCVVPFTALALLAICLRPLAGMCCVDAQGRELTADKSPSPGGDALCPTLLERR